MPVVSGVLTTTGGLVFWGEADGMLRATNAETGEEVWTYDIGAGTHAPPITYEVDGEHYLALAAGWGEWVKGFAPSPEKPRSHSLGIFNLL